MRRLIPKEFQKTIQETFGILGEEWLERLPDTIEYCEQRWAMRIGEPYTLSYNYVAPIRRPDGPGMVIKLGVPDTELVSEAAALRYFDGCGAVRLIDADVNLGILLLERLTPGSPLEELEDDERATRIAALVMHRLWRPVQGDRDLLELKKWTSGLKRLRVEFDGGSGPFPEPLVARAEGLCLELLASMPASTLLHGDLHYWNILSAERESWLAIDPKGIVGDPAFEPAAWLLNPKPRSLSGYDLRRQLERRIDLFSMELGLERQRIIGWGSTLAALSAWWSYEDHGCGWEMAIEVAEQLAKLK